MFSKFHKQIIENIIKKIQNDTDKILINDYMAFHNVLLTIYGRNIFRKYSKWDNMKQTFDINYNHIRDNNTTSKFLNLEKEIKRKLIFINTLHNDDIYIKEFIDYIRYSMKICIDEISVPFRMSSPKMLHIINKYKNNDYVMKYTKKSNKINYEVFDKMII